MVLVPFIKLFPTERTQNYWTMLLFDLQTYLFYLEDTRTIGRLFGILASLLPTSKALELVDRVLDMLSIPTTPLGRHWTYWARYLSFLERFCPTLNT
jgi:hypothetical protein